MTHPLPGDYIDIHTHGSQVSSGIFAIENLMAHEQLTPGDIPGRPCTYGIHPWHLENETADRLTARVKAAAASENLIAIGEAGFDKLRGPQMSVQSKVFDSQVQISEELKKPLYIHCVRAWDELLPAYKKFRPKMPWLIHGFRGNIELAGQLLSKGMYLSFWFDFIIKPGSSGLLRSLPEERIFFETDGAEIDISSIYMKAANDLGKTVEQLKSRILNNYYNFFNTGK